MTKPQPPDPSAPAPLASKPGWELARDTHGKSFPENARNWLALDPLWRAHAEGVIAAMQAVIAGRSPAIGHGIAEVRPLNPEDVAQDWTIDRKPLAIELPTSHDWLLLERDASRLTLIALDADGDLQRVFWDKTLAGAPCACLLGALPAPAISKKKPAAGTST